MEMSHLPESENRESQATTHRCSVCGRSEGHCHRCHHVRLMVEFWPLWKLGGSGKGRLIQVNPADEIPPPLVELTRQEANKEIGLPSTDSFTITPQETSQVTGSPAQ